MERAVKFNLQKEKVDVLDYTRSYHLTRLFNSLSILFPTGERYFSEAVRNYRHLVPELEEEIKLFILEEAQHSMEHRKLNDMLVSAGYDVASLEKSIKRKLESLGKDDETKLIVTTCLEIFTQYGADLLLVIDPIIFKDNEGCNLWRYHAREEAGYGHRTIAHKILNKVTNTSKLKLVFYFVVVMVLLTVQVTENWHELSKF